MAKTLATILAGAMLMAGAQIGLAQATLPDGARAGGGSPAAPPGRGTPTSAASPAAPLEPRTDSSTTSGMLKPAEKPQIDYTAVAGYLPLKDEQGKLRANIFYTAYTLGGLPPATSTAPSTSPATTTAYNGPIGDVNRPLMFLFNGGPGAASAWLHLGAIGPRRLEVPDDGTAPQAPYHVIENEYSWLPAADLVFVDPVNTGYSRAATPEQAKEFLGVSEDISSMGEFIRLYLTKNHRWGSPVYLAGESYGTTRCAGLANYLQERTGVSVSGVILISTVLNFSVLSPGEDNELPFALYLPSYASVAWYHKKAGMGADGKPRDLDGWLKDAQTFAGGDYLAALTKGASLAEDEKQRIAKRFADLTGLKPEYVLESNLRVQPARFEKELLRSPTGEGSKIIGRFDGRLTAFPTDAANDSQDFDPSLAGFYPAYTSAFNDYVRRTLKYENDISYEILSSRVQPWNYGGAGQGYLYVGDDLRNAMTHNVHLRLMVCSGRFDLATPYFATDYQVSHLGLAPELQKNIVQTYYLGGHMLYHVKTELQKLYGDVSGFVAGK